MLPSVPHRVFSLFRISHQFSDVDPTKGHWHPGRLPLAVNGSISAHWPPSRFEVLSALQAVTRARHVRQTAWQPGSIVSNYLGQIRNGPFFSFILPHRPRSHCARNATNGLTSARSQFNIGHGGHAHEL